jgi:REP element-mobilizing transposase RayT
MRFNREFDANTFVECVAEVSSIHRFEILAWTLMGTHYHLVMRTGDVKLWRSMATIQCRVTREHNRRLRVYGAGWQSRYRARLVQSDQDLRNLLAYVHLNPVVAGLVDDPADYELSSHRALIGHAPPVLVDVAVALNTFGEEKLADARAAYLEYVRCVAEAKWFLGGKVRELPWWERLKNDHKTVDAKDAPPTARTFDNRHPNL